MKYFKVFDFPEGDFDIYRRSESGEHEFYFDGEWDKDNHPDFSLTWQELTEEEAFLEMI